MAIKEMTVFVTEDGRRFDSADEAQRADNQRLLSDAMRKMLTDEDGEQILDPAEADGISWHAPELLALLKKHLEPVEATIDEERAIVLVTEILQGGHAYPSEIIALRGKLLPILQGIERPEPMTPDEAIEKLRLLGRSYTASSQIVRDRAEVIAILQAVR